MSIGEGAAVAGDGKPVFGAISCSICLDAVTDDGSRSWAKLLCGHQFHLDCIGSAFNVKGAMQCPNCRKIEKGQWLYATGCRPLPDIVMDDWVHDEDPYDLSYSEMSFGVHWCPFSGFARVPSSLDDGEFSASTYHDLLGHHHAVFAEHTHVPSTNHHTCPYIAFFGPIHPSSAASNGSITEGSTFNGHLAGPSLPNDVSGSYAFPSVDVHYHHGWDHSTPFGTMANRMSAPDQFLVLRTARNGSDIPRPVATQPFILGHGSASRAPSSITSSMVPPYPGAVTRAHRERASFQAQFQQPATHHPQAGRGPAIMTNGRRTSSGHRGGALAHVAPPPSEQQSSGGFYFVSSGRTFQEAEVPRRDHYHFWDREYQQQLSLFPDHDSSSSSASSIWGPFHPPNWLGPSEVGSSDYRQRHNGSQMDRI